MLPVSILKEYGAITETYQKGDIIFHQDSNARFYYQVLSGKVKCSTLNEDGKKFIQGIMHKEHSFGEPPLFGGFKYPSSAIAMEKSKIIQLPSDDLKKLIIENPKASFSLLEALSFRLRYKALIGSELSNETAQHRILAIIHYFKKEKEKTHHELSEDPYCVPFTRLQLSQLTGLRIETVIRNIKELEDMGKLSIKNGKIYI